MAEEQPTYKLVFKENGYVEEIPLADAPKLDKKIRTEHRFKRE